MADALKINREETNTQNIFNHTFYVYISGATLCLHWQKYKWVIQVKARLFKEAFPLIRLPMTLLLVKFYPLLTELYPVMIAIVNPIVYKNTDK